MAPGRKLVTLVEIRADGWAQVPEAEGLHERNRIVAHLSDGREVERFAEKFYRRGEREFLMHAMTSTPDQEKATRLARSILDARAAAVQRVYGELQREFGRGVWA